MAESTTSSTVGLKRLREEAQEEEESKRYKSSASSYNQILSLLEEDEEEPNQDLSSLITSLQQEISSEPSSEPNLVTGPNENSLTNSIQSSPSFKDSSEEDEEDKERVIRHLLEASDDELGIPNSDIGVSEEGDDGIFNGGGGFEFSLCDGLWEFEDETANYYTLLQSELFL